MGERDGELQPLSISLHDESGCNLFDVWLFVSSVSVWSFVRISLAGLAADDNPIIGLTFYSLPEFLSPCLLCHLSHC